MTVPAVVWLLVGLGTTTVLAIVVIALIRQGVLVGRTAMRLAREAGDISQGIGAAGRASDPRR